MKIVAKQPISPSIFKILIALQKVGVSFVLWDSKIKPVYDLCEELSPDILITDGVITQDLSTAINEFKLKTIVADTPDKINLKFGFKPELICLINSLAYIDGYKLMHLGEIADLINFANGEKQEELKTEVTFFSDNPSLNLNELFVLNLLVYPNSNKKFKMVGPVAIGSPAYLGNPSPLETLNILKSSSIVIDLNRQHLLDYAANDIFCISNSINEFMPYYNKDGDMLYLIEKYLSEDKKPLLKKARQKIIKQKLTSYHKAAEMCHLLGESALESKLEECIVSVS